MNDIEPIQTPHHPRNPYIAFFLSLFFIGLGQVYNGQAKKAALFFTLFIAGLVSMNLSNLATQFNGFVLFIIVAFIFRIYTAIDALIIAKQKQDYIRKPYNTWYYHLTIAVLLAGLSMNISISTVLNIQTFFIPVNSNNPTLQVGDRVVADLTYYSSNPINYGDIVIFNGPSDQIWTFRIVGLPNDTIDIVDNIVSVNGVKSKSTFIKNVQAEYFDLMEFEEVFPNGNTHQIYKFTTPADTSKTTILKFIVPNNQFYVLGDNRDNALDSRFIGPIHRDDIKGRIIYTFWGNTTDRINIDLRKN